MNRTLLRFYHQLPAPARSTAATIRGYYLRMWRYGPETERLVEEALEREHWSAERWKEWRVERLAYVLHRAARHVPYYREYWAQRRRQGDRASWQYLENWPILEKESLRTDPVAFVSDDCDIHTMFHEHTSGTTGKPLDVWWSRQTVRAWYALFEARCRRWYGVSRHDRWALLGGQLVVPSDRRNPPFWVWNRALNQLYMSSYHLAPDLIPFYFEALLRYRVRHVLGYTSSLYALAQEAIRIGERPKMAVAVTNAEPLVDYQREAIADGFQCPVRETYGMAELAAAASECYAGHLHLWPEVGWVEVAEGSQILSQGSSGDFVCTGLLNVDMPLVRYRVGDRGALPAMETGCECGRTLPRLDSVEGRTDDVLHTVDGRKVGRLGPVFRPPLAIREGQIVQEDLGLLRVRLVPAPGFDAQTERVIVERLQARMGPVRVVLEQVDKIPREAGGKFRAVISNLPAPVKHQIMKSTIRM